MTESTSLDLTATHKKLSAKCFNDAWTLLDKADRKRDEERLMVATAMASLYHWLQRPDCTAQQLSIGYWQLSRVHAGAGTRQRSFALRRTALNSRRSIAAMPWKRSRVPRS